MEKILRLGRKVIPQSIFTFFQPIYHYLLAIIGGILYGFPSRKIFVIGVTGTKGKSTTAELVNAVLEEAGKKTALAGTIRFKIDRDSRPNLYKMTMPGRFFLQKFLSDAVKKGCTHAIIEMTSEGSKQFRYRFIYPDALIFTNLHPEHIESHGSYEKYREAKLNIARRVRDGGKPRTILVVNSDDNESAEFLKIKTKEQILFSLKDAEDYHISENGISFKYKNVDFHSPLLGLFNLYNILGAIKLTESLGVDREIISKAIHEEKEIPGRAQFITLSKQNVLHLKQDFQIIVDYAHTPDSLRAIYTAFPHKRKIAVFGSTGGGRDTWKRKEMGKVADEFCDVIILTDDDPYDENQEAIVRAIAEGVTTHKPEIIIDRRAAIRRGLELAQPNDVVLITGKGTDPYLMLAQGEKMPWNDAAITREELESFLMTKHA